jgi:hypothetical protein
MSPTVGWLRTSWAINDPGWVGEVGFLLAVRERELGALQCGVHRSATLTATRCA